MNLGRQLLKLRCIFGPEGPCFPQPPANGPGGNGKWNGVRPERAALNVARPFRPAKGVMPLTPARWAGLEEARPLQAEKPKSQRNFKEDNPAERTQADSSCRPTSSGEGVAGSTPPELKHADSGGAETPANWSRTNRLPDPNCRACRHPLSTCALTIQSRHTALAGCRRQALRPFIPRLPVFASGGSRTKPESRIESSRGFLNPAHARAGRVSSSTPRYAVGSMPAFSGVQLSMHNPRQQPAPRLMACPVRRFAFVVVAVTSTCSSRLRRSRGT